MTYSKEFIFKAGNITDYYAGIEILLKLARTDNYDNTFFGPLDDELIQKTGLMIYGNTDDTTKLAFAFMQIAIDEGLGLRRVHI